MKIFQKTRILTSQSVQNFECKKIAKKNLHKHSGPTTQIRPGPGYFSRAPLLVIAALLYLKKSLLPDM